MATHIHDTTVVTQRGDVIETLEHQSLVLDGGRVAAFAPAAELASRVAGGAFDEVVDGRRQITVPGLVNTHHHLYQSLTRCVAGAQDVRLFDWLLTQYPLWRALDREALFLAAQVSIAELLLHGCTTTSDHHYMFPVEQNVALEAVFEAAEALGIRIHACRGSMTLGQSGGGLPPDNCVEQDMEVLRDCERVLDAWHDPGAYSLRRVDLAPCSPFNVTRELLRDTQVLARERGVLLHTHLGETLEEEAYCLERFGCRPMRYLEELDWLGRDVYLAHCVWLNQEEIELLARTGTAVSHNPVSNLRLGSGVAPLQRMLDAGVRVGIGVDGSASNDGGNILSAARMALYLARVLPVVGNRVREDDEAVPTGSLMPARAVFELATTGGAACLGREELGHLNVGAAADVAMFALDDVALAGAGVRDPLAALVFCEPPRASRVFVAGREVVRDGRLVGIDEERLARRFNDLVAQRFRG